MPALKNPRHEKFAQGLAKGLTAEAAYAQAGYVSNHRNPSRLKSAEAIQARVAELVEAGARHAKVDIERVIRELAVIGFSDIRQLFDEAGNLKRPAEMSAEAAAAVASIEVVTRSLGDGEVEHIHKIRTWNKPRALEMLGRHLAMFTDHVKVDGLEEMLAGMTDDQLERFQTELERGLAEAGVQNHDDQNATRY